jgi:hypothetical protein
LISAFMTGTGMMGPAANAREQSEAAQRQTDIAERQARAIEKQNDLVDKQNKTLEKIEANTTPRPAAPPRITGQQLQDPVNAADRP